MGATGKAGNPKDLSLAIVPALVVLRFMGRWIAIVKKVASSRIFQRFENFAQVVGAIAPKKRHKLGMFAWGVSICDRNKSFESI
jgi:hypothetical protein